AVQLLGADVVARQPEVGEVGQGGRGGQLVDPALADVVVGQVQPGQPGQVTGAPQRRHAAPADVAAGHAQHRQGGAAGRLGDELRPGAGDRGAPDLQLLDPLQGGGVEHGLQVARAADVDAQGAQGRQGGQPGAVAVEPPGVQVDVRQLPAAERAVGDVR